MDYYRPKTYASPRAQFSACDTLAGLALIVAFVVTLFVLAIANVFDRKGGGHA